mgnify:CR=1 FL=1
MPKYTSDYAHSEMEKASMGKKLKKAKKGSPFKAALTNPKKKTSSSKTRRTAQKAGYKKRVQGGRQKQM